MILKLPRFGTEVTKVEVHTLTGVIKSTGDASMFVEFDIPENTFLVVAYGVNGKEKFAHKGYIPGEGWSNYHELVHDAEKLKAKHEASLKPVKPRPEKTRKTGWVKLDDEQQPDERSAE